MSLRQLSWIAAFVIWTVAYLWLATGAGVASIYQLFALPTKTHSWLVAALWVAFVIAGGALLAFLMRKAFPGASRDSSPADSISDMEGANQ